MGPKLPGVERIAAFKERLNTELDKHTSDAVFAALREYTCASNSTENIAVQCRRTHLSVILFSDTVE